uniref:Uncharacterized protein n=1 Tax=Magallana gigas TaxID=29159 RepID=A0A8W8I7W7_MAGGI
MAFSILYWANYTAGTRKHSRKSEIAVQSDHVLKFVYDKEASYVRGTVQASMRDRSYNVTVYKRVKDRCEAVMDKKNPKSAPPRQTKTMEELFPAPDRFVNYSNALDTGPRATCA